MKRFMMFLFCATLGCFLYVYEEVDAVKTGYRIRKQEETKVLLVDRARALKYNIARLKAPGNLEKKLAARKITLESPKTWQTLMMPGAMIAPKPEMIRTVQSYPAHLMKFLIGTAQAEAKESKI